MTQTTATAVPELSNQQLGNLIGCTHSMASRIRHGHRLPGDGTMVRIADRFGWPLDDQLRTKLKGTEAYGTKFREVLRAYQRRQTRAAS